MNFKRALTKTGYVYLTIIILTISTSTLFYGLMQLLVFLFNLGIKSTLIMCIIMGLILTCYTLFIGHPFIKFMEKTIDGL